MIGSTWGIDNLDPDEPRSLKKLWGIDNLDQDESRSLKNCGLGLRIQKFKKIVGWDLDQV